MEHSRKGEVEGFPSVESSENDLEVVGRIVLCPSKRDELTAVSFVV
jgi:hypothetical protein